MQKNVKVNKIISHSNLFITFMNKLFNRLLATGFGLLVFPSVVLAETSYPVRYTAGRLYIDHVDIESSGEPGEFVTIKADVQIPACGLDITKSTFTLTGQVTVIFEDVKGNMVKTKWSLDTKDAGYTGHLANVVQSSEGIIEAGGQAFASGDYTCTPLNQ